MTETSTLSLGSIVTWTPPTVVDFTLLKEAIGKTGLDAKMVQEMLPRNAFARASHRLMESRIVRQVEEDAKEIRFQLTHEYLHEHELHYQKEAIIVLDKSTGNVSTGDPELTNRIQGLLDAELKVRKSADVTRLIQRIFDQQGGDLISIREAGGAYFVPANQSEILDRVTDFMAAIKGTIRKFVIGAADSGETSRSVAESMADHFNKLIAEFRNTLEIVTPDSSPAVLKRRKGKIAELRFKLGTFREMLQGNAGEIQAELDKAEAFFSQKRNGEHGQTLPLSVVNDEDSPEVSETADVHCDESELVPELAF